jgi:hypothetical protein
MSFDVCHNAVRCARHAAALLAIGRNDGTMAGNHPLNGGRPELPLRIDRVDIVGGHCFQCDINEDDGEPWRRGDPGDTVVLTHKDFVFGSVASVSAAWDTGCCCSSG